MSVCPEYQASPMGGSFDELPSTETVRLHGQVMANAERPVKWTAEFPTDYVSEGGLTLLIPGWGGIKRSSRAERHANATHGIPCISYEPARKGSNALEDFLAPQELHTQVAKGVLQAVRRTVASERGIPNRSLIDQDKFHLSAHSMGGYAATELGKQYAGMTASVVYKASAGFGSIHASDINLPGFAAEVFDYLHSGQIELHPRHLFRIINYYASNPVRSAGEAWCCMSVDISEQVDKLSECGIPTAYLGFENDPIVACDRVLPVASRVADNVGILRNAGHLAPQRYPVETAAATHALRRQIGA